MVEIAFLFCSHTIVDHEVAAGAGRGVEVGAGGETSGTRSSKCYLSKFIGRLMQKKYLNF